MVNCLIHYYYTYLTILSLTKNCFHKWQLSPSMTWCLSGYCGGRLYWLISIGYLVGPNWLLWLYILVVVDYNLFIRNLFILYIALWLVYDESDISVDKCSWHGRIILVANNWYLFSNLSFVILAYRMIYLLLFLFVYYWVWIGPKEIPSLVV